MENTYQKEEVKDVSETISDIIKGINAGEIVIFCGAGISRDSGLPLVNEIVPYILLRLSSSDEDIEIIMRELKDITDYNQRFDKLIKVISEKMKVSEELILKILNNLPFEAFIQILKKGIEIGEIYNIYEQGEPNTSHILLAKLIKSEKVKTIVTTNFDKLIEKALAMEPKALIEGKDYEVIYKEDDFVKMNNWSDDRIRIIKIHGSIDDKKEMAITLNQIANHVFLAQRNRIIEEVFSKGKHAKVLILGYSSSDVFDLSPEIQSINENHKKVYYVKHIDDSGDLPKVENIQEQTDKNPFRKFEGSQRLYYDTNKLIKTLWESIADNNDLYELKTN